MVQYNPLSASAVEDSDSGIGISATDFSAMDAPSAFGGIEEPFLSESERNKNALMYGFPNTVLGGLSTIAESFGVDEDNVEEFRNALSTAGMESDFSRNQSTYRTLGEVVTAGVTILKVPKIVSSVALFEKVSKVSPKLAQILLPSKLSSMERAKAFTDASTTSILKNQASTITKSENPILSALISKQWKGAASDAFKTGFAVDLAMAGTLNQSDLFFSENMNFVENAAMYVVPTGIVAGIAGRAAYRGALKEAADIAFKAGGKARNFSDLPLNEVTPTPGNRYNTLNVYGFAQREKQMEFTASSGNPELSQNTSSQLQQYGMDIQAQFKLMGKDDLITGVSSKWEMPDSAINTMAFSLKNNPMALDGVVSVEPYVAAKAAELAEKLPAMQVKAQKNYADAYNKLDGIRNTGTESEILKARHDLQLAEKHMLSLDGLTPMRLNTDGSVTNVANIKPAFGDVAPEMKNISTTDVLENRLLAAEENQVFRVKHESLKGDTFSEQLSSGESINTFSFTTKVRTGDKVQAISITDDMKVLLPEQPLGIFNGIDTKKVIDFGDIQPEKVKESMKIFGEVFNTQHGELGKQAMQSLSMEAQGALNAWTRSSVNNILRSGSTKGNNLLSEIETAGERARSALRDVANVDGTITLWRGESLTSAKNARNDVVSMSADPVVARRFATHNSDVITEVKVPVDDVVFVVGGLKGEIEYMVKGNARRSINGNVLNQAGNRSFTSLSHQGKTGVQFMGKEAVRNFDPKNFNKIKIAAGQHHTELDMFLEVAERNSTNPQFLDKVDFGTTPAFQSLDDVEYASVVSKYREWAHQMDHVGDVETGVLKLKNSQKTTIEDLVQEFNLPNDGTTGMHPLMEVFNGLYAQGYKNLDDSIKSFESLQEQLSVFAGKRPQANVLKEQFEATPSKLRGEQFKPLDEEREPVTLLFRKDFDSPENAEELLMAAARERTLVMNMFDEAANEGAPLLTAMKQAATQDPAQFNVAIQGHTLVDGTLLSKGNVTSAGYAISENQVLMAADSIGSRLQTVKDNFIGAMFKEHEQTFNQILKASNEGEVTSFSIAANQIGQGWRGAVLEEVVEGGKLVGYKLKLEDHAFNKNLHRKMYGADAAVDDLYLPTPKAKIDSPYEAMVISPLAGESLNAFNNMSQQALTYINYERRIAGKPPIPRKNFHLPPPDFSNKELKYLLDSRTGELQMVASGNTSAQAQKFAMEEIDLAKKQGTDLFIATESDVANYNMIKLEAFTKMRDFSSSFAQTSQAKGTAFGQTIETGPAVIQRMQESLIRQYNTIGKVATSMVFEPQLKRAAFAQRTAGLQKTSLVKGEDIWSEYGNKLLGVKSGTREQPIGKFYGAVEDAYEAILQKVWDSKVVQTRGGQTESEAQAGFEALNRALPDYNPIKDAEQFLNQTFKAKMPSSMAKHMSKLNNLAGLTMLRMFETGLALVNIGTLPTLIPVVAKALERQPGQSLEQWKNLNAAWSSTISDTHAMWNPYRAFNTGIHHMFTDEGRAILKKAGERGHLFQEVVERMDVITAPSKGYIEKTLGNYAKQASWLVDKSEHMSRAISYQTFYQMGSKNLQLGEEAAMEFAHQMANRVIGDFRPANKPKMFQGAVGAPFGLFTTFAWNYMQRVFGYAEKGQYKTMMQQMGLQASFFGAKSLPGFNQYNEFFTSNYDGSENMVDRLDRNLGSAATDILLFGGVGTLTGLASYTRTDIRLPLSNFARNDSVLDLAPAVGMLKKTYQGLAEATTAMASQSGLSLQRSQEIAAKTFPIKAVRGWIEIGNGQSVDSRGQLIEGNTRSALQAFSKMTSIKTLRDQRVIEEFARERNTMMKQKAIRDNARKALRSLVRSGDLDADSLNNIARDYTKSGGDPTGWGSFMRQNIMASSLSKSELKLFELATDKKKQGDFVRLQRILAEE